MEFENFSAKTKSDAITEACTKFGVPSDQLEYEVVEEGSSGFLGFASKNAVIRARVKEAQPEKTEAVPVAEKVEAKKEEVKETVKEQVSVAAEEKKEEKAEEKRVINPVSAEHGQELCKKAEAFLTEVFHAMNVAVVIETSFDTTENSMDINLSGDEMGVLIGKRGQTLDSMQYLVSLVVNKGEEEYIRIKVDTENYRQRRKDTLENLARNIAFKVKRTRRNFALEAMNPYERRIIHSALQNDKYVETFSEGTEPYRHVVVKIRDDAPMDREKRYDRGRRGGRR
ncbi:MAG: protein jag [Lachnospiraceae bacterium]|nr:protein jag [Lachnospiraceae bacterium]